jgi:predicted transcriptional regulator
MTVELVEDADDGDSVGSVNLHGKRLAHARELIVKIHECTSAAARLADIAVGTSEVDEQAALIVAMGGLGVVAARYADVLHAYLDADAARLGTFVEDFSPLPDE